MRWSTVIAGLVLCSSAFLATSAHAEPPQLQSQNLILVTIDGVRWQEFFGGADARLLETDGVRNRTSTKRRFWRNETKARRKLLMPFLWHTVAAQGQVFGDPQQRCQMSVSNGLNFSYPGYNELLTGSADARIDSNDKRPNPNITVLEWMNRQAKFSGRVAAFASWDVFPFIINRERSGIPVNAGWEKLDERIEGNKVLNRMAKELPHYWDNVRYDVFTFQAAINYLQAKRPRVLYVALGEPDDWAHAGRYDLYLDATQRCDNYIRRLWETAQKIPQYAGKTSLLITTDHGRGDGRESWKNHGKSVVGCHLIWAAVLGPETPALGIRKDLQLTQAQIAASSTQLLGYDLRQFAPGAAKPLPGIHGRR